MGIMTVLKTLFGTSDEEKELRRKTKEALEARKDRVDDAVQARERLEEAQRNLQARADQIQKRQNIDDEETPVRITDTDLKPEVKVGA